MPQGKDAMASMQQESVEDRTGLLEQDDHMRGMERLDMEVVSITRPFPSVARVAGRIAPQDPAPWMPPNQAVRIAVESPEGLRPVVRVYTIRSFDPVQSIVEIDFVLHEDDSPAMRWLNSARPGTRLPMIGPRQHFVPDATGGKPAAIFADETAIPAVWAILTAWPAGARASVWIETADPAAFAELPAPEGVELHLLPRAPSEAPGSTMRLLAAARALKAPGDWTVWAAGERQEMRDLRNHFRAAGIARDAMQVLGYWRKGMSSSELDRVRLAEYEALVADGKRLEDLPDIDLPV